MRTTPGCVLILALCAGASAQDKKDEKVDPARLVGKWSPKEKAEGTTVVIEFTKDGKATFTVTANGKESKSDGTYKADGGKLSMTYRAGDKEVTRAVTVTKLTDAELVIADEKGKEEAFARLKDK